MTAPTVAAPPATRHFAAVDALRALGMFVVLAVHTQFATLAHRKPFVDPLVNRLETIICVFFGISGFVIYRPFVLATFRDTPRPEGPRFFVRRLLRIYPGFWFALTFAIVFLGVHVRGFTGAVFAYTLLFPFSRRYALQGLEQTWSLTAELMFYGALPLYAIALRRAGRGRPDVVKLRIALAAAAVVFAAANGFRALVIASDPSWLPQDPAAVVHGMPAGVLFIRGWLDPIAIGMALAAYSAWEATGHRLPRVISWLGRHAGVSWLLAAAVWLAVAQVGIANIFVFDREYVIRYLFYDAIAFFLLVPTIFGDPARSRLLRGLATRPLLALATASYGFYLIHVPLIAAVYRWFDLAPFTAHYLPLYLGVAAGSVGFATLCHFVVERPLRDVGLRPRRPAERA